MARLTGQPIIRDRLTEGAVRRLRILAELAGSSFYAFDSGDAKLPRALHTVAADGMARPMNR